MKRQHYQLTILLLFIIVSIDVSSDRAVTVSAQSGDHYTTPDNQTIPDVEGAFHQFAYTNNDRKADRHVADLNGFLNDAYRLPTSGTYNKEHLQGIQRINERFLIISGAKKGLTNTENRNKNIAPLVIVEEQVPFDYKVIKGLYPASPTGHNPAHPDNDTFWHAGGMSLAGHYLAVPLESDDASKIVFYDVSSIDDLSEDPTRSVPAKVGEILREPVNDRSNKAGIALLTQLPNRHYLLGVWSDFDDLPARLDLYLSMVPDQLRFYADPVRICSKKNKDDDSRCTNPDASQINLTTRIGYIIPPTTFSKYQSMTFIWNEAGKLYLVATTYTDRLNGDNRTNTLTYQYGPTLEVINTRTYNTLAHAVSLTEAVPNELTLQWDGLTSWPWSAAAIVLESSECIYGPYAFPGTINLENYRCGGPGIAFQELSPDSGTTYIDRIDKIGERGPDIIDNSSGLMLEAKEGEWVEYNVFVEQPGQYDIVIDVYPVSSWTTFHLELNDEDGINYTSTEPIDIPPTATWSQIRVSNIYLESGSQRLRLVNDAGTIRFDRLYTYLSDSQICNYTNLTPLREEVPFVGEPGRMEMENFACGAAGRAFNELSDITGYGSGIYRPDVGTWGPDISRNLSHAGYHLTSTRNGEFVTYNLRVNQSGTYQLKTYLSSAVTDSQFSISIIDQTTGISAYTSGPLTAPNTGSSDNWIFYSLPETITLPVGVYTLRLDILASGAHFDFITLLPPDQIPSIHAAFDFDMTGTLPLTVDFQDQSYWENTSIIRWAWDFDGDGTIDSHEPSPTYVYTEPGHYIISLTVSDGVLEDTATDYIYIDPPLFDADFDSNITGGYAPLTVSFYDESYTDGTSVRYWAWDFDDDGSIDSTEQHPTYTYTESGSYTVILTISDGNYTDSEEKTDYMFVVGRE